MSLVGTRPPTVDEWDKYELHHRARLATKPGLTGMWQVSGRSNITDLALTKGEKANLTKNVQGNDIDILSVKKYMLDSYRKIDNYFEEAVRSKHANDSAAEIRKRSELNYLDTSMRELVAEVSEAHGADGYGRSGRLN